MHHDNTLILIGYSVMPIASVWFFFVAFAPEYRSGSSWIRSVHFVLGIIGLVWSALGFLLVFYSSHFTRQTRFALSDWKSHIGGIAIGLLISLVLSSEFRQLASRSSPFRTWLQSDAEV